LDLNRFSPKLPGATNEKPNIKFEADGSNDNDYDYHNDDNDSNRTEKIRNTWIDKEDH
jgi:hypothetical protein